MVIKKFNVDGLNVKVYNSRDKMGSGAGLAASEKIREILDKKGEARIIFAAAPSQNEVLAYLTAQKDIDWSKVTAFHMDEYIGLHKDAPQGFGNFLKERIFSILPFKSVNYINGNAEDIDRECERYSALLAQKPIDIVLMGIGENGHIAFNDPGEADFNDPKYVKTVTLDEKCRNQQVNDGCFGSIDEVPKKAVTLTIPMLMSAGYVVCTVPAKTKAQAVFGTLRGEITPECPASILRTHKNAHMFLDAESGKKVLFKKAIISDELSQDFRAAASIAAKMGLEALEIRNVWEKAPHELTEWDINKINEIRREFGLKICSISASVFKCDIDNPAEIEEHYERLRKSAALAVKTGTNIVRGFVFWRRYELADILDRVIEQLKKASEIIKEYDCYLVIENEPATPLATADDFKLLFDNIDLPNVRINWDPGNQIYFDGGATTPYPDGYELIKGNIMHVHVKDAVKGLCTKLGDGLLDAKGQLAALLRDGYDGYISLEPHYRAEDENMTYEERTYLGGKMCIEALNRFCDEILGDLTK
jgi:glucosamine-6-phosphate deaminase